MSTVLTWSQLRTAWQSIWRQRSPREQGVLRLGAWVVVLVASWHLALAPALRTWQEAPTRQAQLDTQSQRMRQLQGQAQGLQKPRTISRTEAALWLEKSITELGPNAKISLQGERATLSVQAAPANALARWLGQARENAQALPVQAELQQAEPLSTPPAPKASATTSPHNSDAIWRGSLVLSLP